jgi:hypothetical protein
MVPSRRAAFASLVLLMAVALVRPSHAQVQTIGDPLPGLKNTELNFFTNGKNQFFRVWGMVEGVGPVLTDGGCFRCHGAPMIGGGANHLLTFFGKANQDGTFDPLDGTGASGLNEGGLLLQIRSNQAFLPNCTQSGETLAGAPDLNRVENRLSPPVFGFGLIDAIADADIQAEAVPKGLGIQGTYNVGYVFSTEPFPVHTVGRFGRKAQFANLIEMAASAFAHDLGITNPIVPNEDLPQGQPIDPGCTENTNVPNNPNTGSGGKGIFALSHFMRYLAPAVPAACDPTKDCVAGANVFTTIGCDLCHKPFYTTPANVTVQTDLNNTTLVSPALSNYQVNLWSDLLLHDLGNADRGKIPQGQINTGLATVTMWRTTPLWGLQYRVKGTHFMHDGKVTSLDAAILAHTDGLTGEAIQVIANFQGLSQTDHDNLIAFLNTL